MRFLTTLLPLITLAVHVAATDLEHGSIPLVSVPPQTNSATVRPGDDNPSSYDDAVGSMHLALTSSDGHYAQPAVPGVSPFCVQAATNRALAEATQVTGVSNPSRLRVLVTSMKNSVVAHPTKAAWCATVAMSAGMMLYVVVQLAGIHSTCDSTQPSANCTFSRRRNLDDTNIAKCEHLKLEACAGGTSLTGKHSLGGHGKRDAARMSYRRRLELM